MLLELFASKLNVQCCWYVVSNMFLLLCRQEESLWACLAAMAAYAKQLEVAEVAYAAIDEVS